jgi:hypothetical protein
MNNISINIIEVASWDEFRSLTDTWVERGHFFPSTLPYSLPGVSECRFMD